MNDVAHLQARSPLAGIASFGRHGVRAGVAGVTVRIGPHISAATVIARKGRHAETQAALAGWLGAPVTDASMRASCGARAVIGTAPGQWLALVDDIAADVAVAALKQALAPQAAMTDQGDGHVVLRVFGPRARDALCKGIAIDLDPRVFKPGDSAGTMVAHLAVQISCLDAVPSYEIIGAASTAGNLWHWLEASAAEFGLDVAQA